MSMFLRADDALNQVSESIKDATKRIGSTQFDVVCFPQTWPNSACGFSGIAMQAFWRAQAVLCSGEGSEVHVYHRGAFAYSVKKPTDKFWEKAGRMSLPGQQEWVRSKKVRATFDATEVPE